MAGWAPTHGASPSILRLCERIVAGQQRRDRLDAALAVATRHSRCRRRRPHYMSGMDMSDMDHGMHAGHADRRAADAAGRGPGRRVRPAFLTFMIQHHKGAIAMVDKLFGTAGRRRGGDGLQFASDVYADQTTEIDRMEKMLAALPPAGQRPVKLHPSTVRPAVSVPSQESSMAPARVIRGRGRSCSACSPSRPAPSRTSSAAPGMSVGRPEARPARRPQGRHVGRRRGRLEPEAGLRRRRRRRSSSASPTPTSRSPATTRSRATTTATRSGTSPTRPSRR